MCATCGSRDGSQALLLGVNCERRTGLLFPASSRKDKCRDIVSKDGQ